MKMLVHRAPATSAIPFSIAALKDHVRVDFTDDDAALLRMGLAAAQEIEDFAQIALLTQTIRITIFEPSCESGIALPIGPVSADATATVTIDGEPFTAFRLDTGDRPYISWRSEFYEINPNRLTIEYTAGFGDDPLQIPADLSQVILDQAAHHYEARGPMDMRTSTMSPHMVRIGARYRGVSI